MSLVMSPDTDN